MEQLKQAFGELNIPHTENTFKQYQSYMEGILQWNEKINLTAITDKSEFVTKHFVDSILCYNFPEYQEAKTVIDIGTGGGFPGVPLAIASPEKKFILADSLQKRLKVIDELTAEAGILNTVTVHGRAEELAKKKEYRQSFDLCVSRAVANMAVLAEYCLPYIRVGGYLLAYKGPDAESELQAAKKAVKILGGEFVRIQSAPLDGYDHNIVVIKKIKDTPAKYPRKAGTPAKTPIL